MEGAAIAPEMICMIALIVQRSFKVSISDAKTCNPRNAHCSEARLNYFSNALRISKNYFLTIRSFKALIRIKIRGLIEHNLVRFLQERSTPDDTPPRPTGGRGRGVTVADEPPRPRPPMSGRGRGRGLRGRLPTNLD